MDVVTNGAAAAGSDSSSPFSPDALAAFVAADHIQDSAIHLESFSSRIAVCVTTATDDLRAAIASVVSSLASSRHDFVASRQSIVRMRSMWMDKHVEELDAVEKSLTGCARAAGSLGADPVTVYSDLATILHVLNVSVLPRLSYMVSSPLMPFKDASAALSVSTCIQADVDLSQCVWSGSGLDWCDPSTSPSARVHNTVTLAIVDSLGEPVRGIEESDVSVSLTHGGLAGAVSLINASQLQFSYTVPSDVGTRELTLSCSVFGVSLLPRSIPVGGSIMGNHLPDEGFDTKYSSNNWGLALIRDGHSTTALISSAGVSEEQALFVYTKSGGGSFVADPTMPRLKVGGSQIARKLCVAPNGNILLALDEGPEKGPIEMSLSGSIVRRIGSDVLPSHAWSVACSSRFVAMGLITKSGDLLYLFAWPSGEFVRSFGTCGPFVGQLSDCVGLRFTPDGNNIAVAEQGNDRVSILTLEGLVVRIFASGLLYPRDVEFARNGDLIVADYGHNTIKVFSMDTPVDSPPPLREFGGAACGLHWPTALSIHNGKLHVICQMKSRMEVFS